MQMDEHVHPLCSTHAGLACLLLLLLLMLCCCCRRRVVVTFLCLVE